MKKPGGARRPHRVHMIPASCRGCPRHAPSGSFVGHVPPPSSRRRPCRLISFGKLAPPPALQAHGLAGWKRSRDRLHMRCHPSAIPRCPKAPWTLTPHRKPRQIRGKPENASAVSFRKEVIQPQVPLRLPCYDLVPIAEFILGAWLLAVTSATSDAPHFRGLTGGVYKAQEHIHRGMLTRDY